MNKRKIKKFCKKGGHYHFDKTIRRISHKRMMYPYVSNSFGHMISWCEVGTCLTCAHCTDVCIDWDGTPYMCWGSEIGCGGSDKFSCKRYKLDTDLKFFKYEKIHNNSPDSELKRYIDDTIEGFSENKDGEPSPIIRNEPFFDDMLLKLYGDMFGVNIDELIKGIKEEDDNED
jgi:hypothetical protein